jgi:hypothetical protein
MASFLKRVASIVNRYGTAKGSALTNEEIDSNFANFALDLESLGKGDLYRQGLAQGGRIAFIYMGGTNAAAMDCHSTVVTAANSAVRQYRSPSFSTGDQIANASLFTLQTADANHRSDAAQGVGAWVGTSGWGAVAATPFTGEQMVHPAIIMAHAIRAITGFAVDVFIQSDHGGPISSWVSGASKTLVDNHMPRFITALNGIKPSFVVWDQGDADSAQSDATYAASGIIVKDWLETLIFAGDDAAKNAFPWIIMQCMSTNASTYTTGVNLTIQKYFSGQLGAKGNFIDSNKINSANTGTVFASVFDAEGQTIRANKAAVTALAATSSASSGASSYLNLSDTSDSSFSGKAKYIPEVNAGGTGLTLGRGRQYVSYKYLPDTAPLTLLAIGDSNMVSGEPQTGPYAASLIPDYTLQANNPRVFVLNTDQAQAYNPATVALRNNINPNASLQASWPSAQYEISIGVRGNGYGHQGYAAACRLQESTGRDVYLYTFACGGTYQSYWTTGGAAHQAGMTALTNYLNSGSFVLANIPGRGAPLNFFDHVLMENGSNDAATVLNSDPDIDAATFVSNWINLYNYAKTNGWIKHYTTTWLQVEPHPVIAAATGWEGHTLLDHSTPHTVGIINTAATNVIGDLLHKFPADLNQQGITAADAFMNHRVFPATAKNTYIEKRTPTFWGSALLHNSVSSALSIFGNTRTDLNKLPASVTYSAQAPHANAEATFRDGGNVILRATAAAANFLGIGGSATVEAGAGTQGGTGGETVIRGGAGQGGGSGGAVTVTSGAGGVSSGTPGIATFAAADAIGGNIVGGQTAIRAGKGFGTGNGGVLGITSGAGGATGDGGILLVAGGVGGTTSGAGGIALVSGGNATAGDSAGGYITASGGNSSGNVKGGNATFKGGIAGATGIGGDVLIAGGIGGATSGSGGLATFQGGDATAGNSAGGQATVRGGSGIGSGAGALLGVSGGVGGATGVGGALWLTGGGGGVTSGNGGVVNLYGGSANAAASTGTGGNINLFGGGSKGSAGGGIATLAGGAAGATGAGGAVWVVGASGGATSGSGGGVGLVAGSAIGGNSAGGAFTLNGGNGFGTGNGGNVTITPGLGGASGAKGVVLLNGQIYGDAVIVNGATFLSTLTSYQLITSLSSISLRGITYASGLMTVAHAGMYEVRFSASLEGVLDTLYTFSFDSASGTGLHLGSVTGAGGTKKVSVSFQQIISLNASVTIGVKYLASVAAASSMKINNAQLFIRRISDQ